jgi:hypothetical protein
MRDPRGNRLPSFATQIKRSVSSLLFRLWEPVISLNRIGTRTSQTREIQMAGVVSQGIGAPAVGALAIAAVAVGRLAIRRTRIRQLEIDELVVRRLRVTEKLQISPAQEVRLSALDKSYRS